VEPKLDLSELTLSALVACGGVGLLERQDKEPLSSVIAAPKNHHPRKNRPDRQDAENKSSTPRFEACWG